MAKVPRFSILHYRALAPIAILLLVSCGVGSDLTTSSADETPLPSDGQAGPTTLAPEPTITPEFAEQMPSTTAFPEDGPDGASIEIGDFGSFLTLNEYVSDSDLAVSVTIEFVSESMWNSASGRPWDDSSSGFAALQYRDIGVRIEDVLFAEEPATLASSDSLLEFRAYGSGVSESTEIGDLNLVSGPLDIGEAHILLLKTADFPTQDGLVQVLRLTAHRDTNWLISGDSAQRLERPPVSVDELRSAILDEHRNGDEISDLSEVIDRDSPSGILPSEN